MLDDERQRGRRRVLLDDQVSSLAARQGGVITLAQLRRLGVTRGVRRAQVASGRWDQSGSRTVRVRTETAAGGIVPLCQDAADDARVTTWWSAVGEVGPLARLGGVTALLSFGMTGFEDDQIHVWVEKSTRPGQIYGVRVHESRRWGPEHVMPGPGVPRARPEVAAVQAALWAPTLRQATLLLVMPVQQRLVDPRALSKELGRVKRHRYRADLQAAMLDILDGAQSLGELDFAAECRARGLPEPERQVPRRGKDGRVYLDVHWDRFGLVLEIDGTGHLAITQRNKDDLRDLELQVEGNAAVRVTLWRLRNDPEPFFEALRRLLVARGWRPAAA